MVIGLDGRMSDQAGDLAGLTQAEADAAVVAWIKERGQLVKRENYRHAVGTCERCHSRIEPLISLQWWCRMEEPAQPAIEALRERRVRYHPESQHRFAIASLRGDARTGASRGSSGGATSCRSGRRRTARSICAATEEEAQEQAGSGVRSDPRPGRPRHLVLVGALAVRDARLAGRRRPSSRRTTRATSTPRRARSSASGRTA